MSKFGDYVDIVNSKTLEFPTPESAGLFIRLCQGVDKARDEEYDFDYGVKLLKNKSVVTVIDYVNSFDNYEDSLDIIN